jgi:hypothetical protein
MSEFDSESPFENEWEERGDLAWNEFDWERYLREQDGAIHRYLAHYESLQPSLDRIDEAARRMGWEPSESSDTSEEPADEAPAEAEDFSEEDVYTLHKNPVFIATKAIYLSLRRSWEKLASEEEKVPPPLALAFLTSLHQGEDQAIQAIHALDFGDYAMAVSQFKRALSALNGSLALLTDERAARLRTVMAYRECALVRLFDLREIWLRVVNECREELDRPSEE